eukprot:6213565-Pleurochrysis_carterae.AAC.3
MVKGSGAGGGLARLRGGFDADAQRGDVGHARTGARKLGAKRERFASTQAMPMQNKCKNGKLCMRAMKRNVRGVNCDTCTTREVKR